MHGTLGRRKWVPGPEARARGGWYAMTEEQRIAAYWRAEEEGLTAAEFCRRHRARDSFVKFLRTRGLFFTNKAPAHREALTPEQIASRERIRSYRRKCLPFSQIAKLEGITRAAAIGRAWRANGRSGDGIKNHPGKRHKRTGDPNQIAKVETRRAAVLNAKPPENGGNVVWLRTSARRHCQFIGGDPKAQPIDDLRCCGAPVIPGESWCPWHYMVVTGAVKRRAA